MNATTRMNLWETYPEFFAGRELDLTSFQRGEQGAVVLDFGPDDALASTDGGLTWHRYEGKRLWPTGAFPVARVGRELVALMGGKSISRSSDEGLTWSQPESIAPATSTRYTNLEGPYVFSITITRRGRLIIPEDYLTGREGPDLDVLFVNGSSDGGRTWQRSPIIEPPDPLPKAPGCTEGFGEPSVVELADSTLWMVFRTSYGHLWQSVSTDEGLTWGPPCSTGLASPASNVKAYRIPGSDSVALFWNFCQPGPSRNWDDRPNIWFPREPLVFAVSHDNCRSWSCPTVMFDGYAGYAQAHFSDSEMFVVFGSRSEPGAKRGLTLVVYDKQRVLDQPAWTYETIQPYIADGRVAHWLALNIPQPGCAASSMADVEPI